METMLKEGLSYTSTMTVSPGHTAQAMGSGDLAVLATPSMIALMENAAMKAVQPYLPEGMTTVGGHIECSHLSPTRIGGTVSATATLVKIDRRKLFFDIEAVEDGKVIGRAKHIRFIVDPDKF